MLHALIGGPRMSEQQLSVVGAVSGLILTRTDMNLTNLFLGLACCDARGCMERQLTHFKAFVVTGWMVQLPPAARCKLPGAATRLNPQGDAMTVPSSNCVTLCVVCGQQVGASNPQPSLSMDPAPESVSVPSSATDERNECVG